MALHDYNLTGTLDIGFAKYDADRLGGQTFTASSSYVLGSIKVKMNRVNNPGSISVDLYYADEDGFPTGVTLSSGSTDGDTLPAISHDYWEEREITLSDLEMVEGLQYAVVFDQEATTEVNYFNMAYASGNPYAGGTTIYKSYDEWAAIPTSDLYFATYSPGTFTELTGTIAGTSVFELSSGLPAKAITPSPANTATSINLSTGFTWTNGARTDTTALEISIGTGYVEVTSGLEVAAYNLVSDYFSWGMNVSWRIISTNAYGSTTGDAWTFTTLEKGFLYPSWTLIDGGSGNGPDDGGIEGTDFLYTGFNNMITVKTFVAAAKNRIYYNTF